MKRMSAALFCYFIHSFSIVISVYAIKSGCPSPNAIVPCTCRDQGDKRTVDCRNLRNVPTLRKALSYRGERFHIEEVNIWTSTLSYIPQELFQRFFIDQFFIERVNLVQLFDEPPKDASSLKGFTLRNVLFQRIPDWSVLEHMKNLEMLEVYETPVKMIGDENFKKHVTKNLKEISFERTGLGVILPSAFSDLENLVTITIQNCKLKNLTRGMFPKKALHLTTLYLNDNNIAFIPEDLFQNMPKLETLTMKNNKIRLMPESAFEGTPKTGHFMFQDNPLRCSCALRWMFERAEDGIKPAFFGTCDTPDSMRGAEVRYLELMNFTCEEAFF